MKNISKFILAAFAALLISTSCAKQKTEVTLEDIKKLAQNHALVVAYNDGTVRTYDDKGIKPLFRHIAGYGDFKDAFVFDKVTGKGSALILAYGGAENLYTGILSKEAVPILERYNINYTAEKVVDFIFNNDWDDTCPVEKTVDDIDDPQEAYRILLERFNR